MKNASEFSSLNNMIKYMATGINKKKNRKKLVDSSRALDKRRRREDRPLQGNKSYCYRVHCSELVKTCCL
jgi:polyribonucleotide nucleotidyltransferase